ncbi:hypothetical protein [Pseudomonas japonica]|uniref:hypothetical protein n=1 Tax=Pseudomonas japonica TaxID=256466 RepID=UPI0015E2E15D|nr:hypothetical protein [Pseudomonas japonica]MBA1245833.1 hypothetical protein [Pseudomonas japonica]
MAELFEGRFYTYLLSTDPLRSATYYKHGSSSSLFVKDGQLYRLTRQGCGHNFIASESASGNPCVTRVLRDFGPVAPSDEDEGEHYWLAEVEWLKDVNPQSASAKTLAALLDELTEGEPQLEGEQLEEFGRRCSDLAMAHGELSGLLTTLARMATFAIDCQAMADIKLDNIMVRPRTNEYVLADPICDQYYPLENSQLVTMTELRSKIETR